MASFKLNCAGGADEHILCSAQKSNGDERARRILSLSNPLTQRLADFVRHAGISVEAADLAHPNFLPGLEIRGGALLIDEARLRYPGDILHEAGHIAVSDPRTRHSPQFFSTDGEEIATLAWSYAAICALKLPPEVVFHPDGYKGSSPALVENFTAGRYIGVPLLQLWGMTVEPRLGAELRIAPFPRMLRWLR
jgi:hypothetical protein